MFFPYFMVNRKGSQIQKRNRRNEGFGSLNR